MGFGGGRKVSRRGLIIIAALLFGIALSARQTVHVPHQSTDHPSGVLVMLSKKSPTSSNRTVPTGALSSMAPQGANNSASSRLQLAKGAVALFKGGTLTESETWTSGQTYVIEGRLVVPSGITLTVQAGVIIKVMNGGEGIIVRSGGAVVIRGTSTNPVTMTSFYDANGGGLSTAAAGPAVGDYRSALVVHDGASIVMNHLQVRYAETAFVSAGLLTGTGIDVSSVRTAFLAYQGGIRLNGVAVNEAEYGIVAEGGAVVLEGSLHDISQRPVRACNWENEACFVDATALYIASSQGATASSGPDWCGRVMVEAESFFASRNCDGSALPAKQLLDASGDFSSRWSFRIQECNDGNGDACQMAQNATACIDGAAGAMNSVPFALPDMSPVFAAEQWAADLDHRASEYLRANQAVFSVEAERRADLATTIRILHMAASAYRSCTP